MDRCIKISLQRISTQQREPLSALRTKFHKDLPRILGALFELLKQTLPLLGTIHLDTAPRLADFYSLGGAISKALWGREQVFFEAFAQNEESKFADVVEEDPLSSAVKKFAEQMGTDTLRLSPTELFEKLKAQIGGIEYMNPKNSFPSNASILGRRIPRIQPGLAAIGIDITQTKCNGQRYIKITRKY